VCTAHLTLEGEGADVVTVTAASSADHVFEVGADWVNISRFAVRGATDNDMAGIRLNNVDCCNISGNNVYGNYRGIWLSSSSNNTLTNNNCSNNEYGIYLYSSSNNTLTNNNCSNNMYGIYLHSSSNNTLTNNNASNNPQGIFLYSSSNNTLTNNTVNSNKWGNGIYLHSSSNNTLTSNTASNNRYGSGIILSSSSNNTLTNNNCSNNEYGINIGDAGDNNITCNWVQSNIQSGFRLYNADNNNITCNWVHHNTQYGFYLSSGSTGNNINYNNIIENGNYNTETGGWEWQFYMNQYQPVEAKHNYWGAGMNSSTIDASIYDDEEGGWGEVEFYPFETEPVTPENIPPIASFTYDPLNPIVNQTVTFNASNSSDSDGTITNFEWDFGDGNTTNTTEETTTHFYASVEDYTVNLTVTDDKGATNSTSKAIIVYPPTIIYVPDDYAKIQWAVDNASTGDTIFVWNGSYTENVNVNKRLTLEGEGADVVTVTAASSSTVFKVTANYVNISGFAVRGATDSSAAGIRLTNADYCGISWNNVYGNQNGIYLYSSSNNTLTDNTANLNQRDGIYLDYSSNHNTLTGNNASNNKYGISVESNNNKLTSNTVSNNTWGGIYLRSSNSNNLTGNTANSDDNSYGIFLRSSSNNNLTSNTANSNDCCGILLEDSSNHNTLTGNNASNNKYGIYLRNADNNIITCNWVQNNLWGFCIDSGSTGNNINYNNIIENGNYNTETGGWEWQFYMNQYQPVEAKHNYWGAGMNSSTIDASIYDTEGGYGEVEFYPFETEPVPCTPTPEAPPTFTTADAVIALQIAAGSRPPDLRWDVSGDKRVTSLDALMILQAAAGR